MAAPMTTENNELWQLTMMQMPPNTIVSYQYVRWESDGSYIYEAANRTLTTGDCHSAVLDVSNVITTRSGPYRRSVNEANQFPSRDMEVQKRRGNQIPGGPRSMMGLPGRDLLNPPYMIHNSNGALSEYTINTDIIQANGYTAYDDS